MSTEWEQWRARPRRLPRRLFVVGPRGGDAGDALQPLLLQRHDEDEDDGAIRMRRSEAAWRGDEDERCASCGEREMNRTGPAMGMGQMRRSGVGRGAQLSRQQNVDGG